MGPFEAQLRQETIARRARMGIFPPPERPRFKLVPKAPPPKPHVPDEKEALAAEMAKHWFAPRTVKTESCKWIDGEPVNFVGVAPPPSIHEIQTAVALLYGVTVDEIKSDIKPARVVLPRQVACYLAHKVGLRGFAEIGRRTGNRDHTTTMHAYRRVRDLIPICPEVAERVSKLEAQLTQ